MIYIYHDYGGTHTTSLAAAFHLQLLKPSSLPLTSEEVLAVPYFNKLTKKDAGHLLFHGQDADGHKVFTIGKKSSKLIVPALYDMTMMLFEHFQVEDQIILSNTSPTVPFVMSIGGGLSRGLGIDALGVPLLIKGAKKCSPLIYDLVEHTKKQAHQTTDKVLLLDNKLFKI
ncbi:DUF3189 family protein [Bacillus sp. RAR_GA_16]|uniref:DUF3189 family protein n=1 Tax=Bacillus sp. RAR_GA_16 TaxID=2876774 RepID=UPI001CCA4512|nr:DUF3189 family protein [Bacillus sp. RAR_GA_16]MCA0173840.1 DUF3189 family protein [Bacillus sp. RAR_GA_16]